MKKRILAMLLSALLVANISSCNYVAENGTEAKTNETETLETNPTESSGTESDTQSPPFENESNNDLPSQNEIVRDVPGVGQLRLCSYYDNSPKASVWWSDEKEECYIYINDWDTYRQWPGLYSYLWVHLNDNCIVIDNEATTVSLVYQEGKHHEPIIVTYRFSRSNELVEIHAVPLNIKASSEYDTYFVNMHDANHGYYFLTSNMDGDHYWRINEFPGGM